MKLIPPIAPGRTNRRARAFDAEIARLHREGFSYVAIQRALADAGVSVSKSTVQREVARIGGTPSPLRPLASPAAPSPPRPVALKHAAHAGQFNAAPARPSVLTNEQASPRDIAAAFIKSQITNPLFKNRS